MRTYDDAFSGVKIYPGKGKIFVRGDSKVFRFQNGKSESLFLQRKNPRRIAWTVLARRANRKGAAQEMAKTKKRKMVKKNVRGIEGMKADVITDRRSQPSSARKADREAAIKKAKEARKAQKSQKKSEGGAAGNKVSKMGAKGAATKVAATSR